jgi:cytochrome oxidase assembly protein ShyY1
MQFNFSLKTTLICGALALGMVRASIWQWDRHLQKQELVASLNSTLHREVVDLNELISSSPNWQDETWRRVRVSGTYDFSRETLVRRNRGSHDHAGFHVITPLKIDTTGESTGQSNQQYILIDRGFIPLGREEREYRKRYQNVERVTLHGIVKQSSEPGFRWLRFLVPQDPDPTPQSPWIDLWKRVNIAAMQKQLPYSVLPIYLEVMENPDDPLLAEKIVKEGSAGRNDVLALTGQKKIENFGLNSPDAAYPLPHFDTTPPADIHLGYVYEWAFMALLTIGIGVIAQFRRPKA